MENNKLIAEFMGINIGEYTTYPEESPTQYAVKDLQYQASWDWLMPVIEKCLVGEAEQSEEISNTTIKNIYNGICSQDISFAYKSVVEFIKEQKN